jgi:hypothetical protein
MITGTALRVAGWDLDAVDIGALSMLPVLLSRP